MAWEPTEQEPEDREAVVFPCGNGLPSTKLLSFTRPLPFDISVSQAGGVVSAATIGDATSAVPANSVVKVKAKMSLCHTVTLDSAQIVEDYCQEESEEGGEARRKQRKSDIPVVFVHTGLVKDRIARLQEEEASMAANDKLVRDTADCKNALEEYIYSSRSKLDGVWSRLATDAERKSVLEQADATESWLYSEEGEDATKSVYQKRLDALKKLGDPLAKRLVESEERPRAEARLKEQVATYLAFAADEKAPKYAHIGLDDRQRVRSACDTAMAWLTDALAKQSQLKAWEKPAVTAQQIDAERDRLINVVAPIMLKPRPATPVSTSETKTGNDSASSGAPRSEATATTNDIPDMDMD
jgi:heat shock protein 4